MTHYLGIKTRMAPAEILVESTIDEARPFVEWVEHTAAETITILRNEKRWTYRLNEAGTVYEFLSVETDTEA